ncbi:MAG: hypothetical protein GX051_05105 [Clostridiales bacterium]|nr:hypothetical protein [Clostridiales bacterium]
MKKLTRAAALIITAMLILTCMPLSVSAVQVAGEPYCAGDVDGDGIVTAADARKALRIATKLEAPENEESEYAADVDWVPGVSASDARAILRAATGLSAVDIPSSKEGIVNYFNAKSNDVKNLRPGMTRVDTATATEIGSSNALLNTLIKSGLTQEDMAPKTSEPIKVSPGKSLINRYPVAGRAWSSKLLASDVKSAIISKSGDNYIVTIVLTDRTYSELADDPTQTAHGKVFDLPSRAEVESGFSALEGGSVTAVRPSYKNAQVKLTVSAATGNAVAADYDIDMTFDMDIQMENLSSVMNVYFTTHSDVEITLGAPVAS